MPTASGSQSWLKGVDDTLDNFFRAGAKVKTVKSASGSSTLQTKGGGSRDGAAGVKRKAKVSDREGGEGSPAAKKVRSASSTIAKAENAKAKEKEKGKTRQVLGNLTSALQNSPRRRSNFSVSPKRRKTIFASPSRKAKARNSLVVDGNTVVLEDSDSDSESTKHDVPTRLPALNFGKTPHHHPKSTAHHAHNALPTPPSSSILHSRKLPVDECGSSPTLDANLPKEGGKTKRAVVHTPFVPPNTSAKQAYPTPTSIVVPRLKLVPQTAEGSSCTLPAPALNLGLDSDSPLTSLSSSPESSQVENQVESESPKKVNVGVIKEDKSRLYEVIPPSQTQYIHYSPTKQRHTKDLSVHKLKPLSLTVIPSPQPPSSSPSTSQVISLSPRKIRRPAPIVTTGLTNSSTSARQEGKDTRAKSTVLNFVVPTSQDDEVEISFLDGAMPLFSQLLREHASVHLTQKNAKARVPEECEEQPARQQDHDPAEKEGRVDKETTITMSGTRPSQSTQIRFINAMLDKVDRLTDEMQANIVSVSQVLSRSSIPPPPLDDSHAVSRQELISEPRKRDLAASQKELVDARGNQEDLICMQSSVTEPDVSQWEEDPFSLTNEAYVKHLGLPSRVSDRQTNPTVTSTQSSSTQPDTQDEDPFPTLPPASTAESTADKDAVNRLLFPTPEQRYKDAKGEDQFAGDDGQVESSQTESETQPDSEDGSLSFPMPNIVSQDDTLDMRLLTPRAVLHVVSSTRGVSRFRRGDDHSSHDFPHNETAERTAQGTGGDEEEEEGEDKGESMPRVVRDFLAMFSQTQEDR